MPAGKGKPAGGYRAGKKGSYGCSGFPTVSADGTVHGCHPTKAQAAAQARAIWASTTAKKFVTGISKSMVTEGDFVMYMGEDEEIMVGRVEYVMTNPGLLGLPGSEYALEYAEDDKPIIVRKYEQEDGAWEEEEYVCYHRMSEVIKIESLSVSVDLIVEMGSDIPVPTEEVQMAMYDAQIGKAYEGCGCPTCKELNVNCENCPVCGEEMSKAKPNYEEMIKPRSGGSDPANSRLYARIMQEAKDRFDVYPSAVANAWVVAEYKRRGGTYKSDNVQNDLSKAIWENSMFDLNSVAKRDYNTEDRRRMASEGNAMPDGSYPIANRTDLMNAIRSWGRGGADPKVKSFIMRRARALNAENMIPENWK